MQNQSAPVTPVELLERQLRDWQVLRKELEEKSKSSTTPELVVQIAYCTSKIKDLTAELTTLK